jgi:hypothetical protein
MSNMSYARFRNTLADLVDCLDNIYEEVSPEEGRARRELIRVAFDIVEDFLTDGNLLDIEEINHLPITGGKGGDE